MLLRHLKLFTNVPLKETIHICADALYCDDLDAQPLISKAVFIELMKSATSEVEFSFNDIIYKQTYGVAMGSPLGPDLANIFVGFYEKKLFSQISKPSTYFRYVDDTFAMFRNEEESDNFFNQLNCLHPSLKFTSVPLRKRKIIVYRFLTLTWNEQLPVLKLVYIENVPLLDRTYVGNLSVPLNKNTPYINFGTTDTNGMHEI